MTKLYSSFRSTDQASLTCRAIALIGCFGLSALVAVGCSSRNPGYVSVSGMVSLDGAPVPTGHVEFFPASGRPARGPINEDGRYTLTTFGNEDGVKPGSYRVAITARNSPEDQYASMEDELNGTTRQPTGEQDETLWIAPEKYSSPSSSELTAEVTGDGEDINFSLTSARK